MKKDIVRVVNFIVGCAVGVTLLLGVCACEPVPYSSATEWKTGEFRMHFIDVGQGDCALIELPDGKKMMIDGGNGEETPNRKIIAALDELKIDKIDYLIASHADVDHVGGLSVVVDRVDVVNVYLPYQPKLNISGEYFDFYDKVTKKAVNVHYSKRHVHEFGGNYFFTFLYPYATALENLEDDNENSAVVWLKCRGVSALFTGDMTSESEMNILLDYQMEGEIFDEKDAKVRLENLDILKVAHHGSEYSSSLEWLQLLSPQTAIISCGKNNRYDHPSQNVMENLRRANPDVEIYRTDECGNVVVSSTAQEDYQVNYEKEATNQTLREGVALVYIQNIKNLERTKRGSIYD